MNEEAVKNYVDQTVKAFGRIDGLYNNAGIEGRQASSVTRLVVTPDGLTDSRGRLIVRFSKKFIKVIAELFGKGYLPVAARTNFVVHWWNKETGKEVKIVLPDVGFGKRLVDN